MTEDEKRAKAFFFTLGAVLEERLPEVVLGLWSYYT
jgi:hypothetical protein